MDLGSSVDGTVRLAVADVSALAQHSRRVPRLAAAALHVFGLALEGVQLVEVRSAYLTPVNGYVFPVRRPFLELDQPRPLGVDPVQWLLDNTSEEDLRGSLFGGRGR